MDLSRISRIIERGFFWALLGALTAVILIRLLLLVAELKPLHLTALLLIGAWSGVFLSRFSSRYDDAMFIALRSRTPRLRAMSLKAMLWLLGTAAVIGVLTVLTASYDILGRVAGTILVTAVAAGFLWPLSIMIDSPKMLAAGLFGMAAVVVVYSLVIPLIWELDHQDEEILFSSLVIGLTTPVGMMALLMVRLPRVQFAGRVGTVLYALVLASFFIAIWHPEGWRAREEWWECGWWLAVYGGLSVACLSGFVPSIVPDWRWLGALASATAWYFIMAHEWGQWSLHEKTITLFTSLAVVVAHTSLTLFVPLTARQVWVRIGTSIALATTAAFVNFELHFSPGRGVGMLGRIAGAAGVVASCGTLALIVLARLNRGGSRDDLVGDFSEVTLYCPQCRSKQTLPLGGGECPRCGLAIQLTVRLDER